MPTELDLQVAPIVQHPGDRIGQSLGNRVGARQLLGPHHPDGLRLYIATQHDQSE
jgi:hypothetical protein